MSVKPILFSGPMVRALLEGRKTQHRMALKGAPIGEGGIGWSAENVGDALVVQWPGHDSAMARTVEEKTILPPYEVDDLLYVKEPHYRTDNGHNECVVYAADGDQAAEHLRAIEGMQARLGLSDDWANPHRTVFNPNRMPRWASRITLPVTNVRVERLQDISEEDAWAEGLRPPCEFMTTTQFHTICTKYGIDGIRASFADLWDSLNAKRGYGWDANPWVSVTEWKEIHVQNVDEFLKERAA